MEEPFSLRKLIEKPLVEADETISSFAKSIRAKVLLNYRDYPSRTIYWRERRMLKYIQLKLVGKYEAEYKKDELLYRIFISAIKIRIPLIHFWNARFERGGENYIEIGILKSPLNAQALSRYLEEAYAVLKNV